MGRPSVRHKRREIQGDPSGGEPGLGWHRFWEFLRLVAAIVATYCPSRMVEHSRSKSTQPRFATSWVTLDWPVHMKWIPTSPFETRNGAMLRFFAYRRRTAEAIHRLDSAFWSGLKKRVRLTSVHKARNVAGRAQYTILGMHIWRPSSLPKQEITPSWFLIM